MLFPLCWCCSLGQRMNVCYGLGKWLPCGSSCFQDYLIYVSDRIIMSLVSFSFLFLILKMLFCLSPHMESFSGFSSRCLQMSFPWSELKISISWNFKDRVIFICCWVKHSSSIFLQQRALFAWLESCLQFSFFLKHHILILFFRNSLLLFRLKIDINVMPPFLFFQELSVLLQIFQVLDCTIKL